MRRAVAFLLKHGSRCAARLNVMAEARRESEATVRAVRANNLPAAVAARCRRRVLPVSPAIGLQHRERFLLAMSRLRTGCEKGPRTTAY